MTLLLCASGADGATGHTVQQQEGPVDPSAIERTTVAVIPLAEAVLGTPVPIVAVADTLVYLAWPPYDGASLEVYTTSGTPVGQSDAWLPARTRVTELVSWRGTSVAIRLRGGALGILSAVGGEEQWTETEAQSIDARGDGTRLLSVRRITTPNLFGHWWYYVDPSTGDVTPGAARPRVDLTDEDLLAIRAHEETICGLSDGREYEHVDLLCWSIGREGGPSRIRIDPPVGGRDQTYVDAAFDGPWLWVIWANRGGSNGFATTGYLLACYRTSDGAGIGQARLEERPLSIVDGGFLVFKTRASWSALQVDRLDVRRGGR